MWLKIFVAIIGIVVGIVVGAVIGFNVVGFVGIILGNKSTGYFCAFLGTIIGAALGLLLALKIIDKCKVPL
ncbi:hypothetical protein ACOBQJ_00980 [Pelotomaculum propionicicum]|uniref:hypothetical protein n=1 Tax=Pelotomaculum propionicicum TaxID=258475 RepID=UPI003B7C2242